MSAKRILVIDDEAVILEVIQGCLEELGDMEVLMAASGIEGLQIAQTALPDGILLDVSMPGMDGFTVLRQLQENTVTQKIPVVLLTARVQPEDRAAFAQTGVAGVILKPFDPIALVDQVTDVFGWTV
ncbi:response regulator [Phormidium sp. FACHB-592]|uniref:Response regulator n=1 Tax=Stenomitos frigidus AS-A4 TaxID=2933935 RepID=A0ABV0KKF4_9CYAN|nr:MULTISPECIES: response regulator [Cyanophyceae]MBD2033731.1 response regulator [Leptolyngbya sp. FACHB-321]MBD2072710.1 response regulator [Phormidium sp. FACHB-592]